MNTEAYVSKRSAPSLAEHKPAGILSNFECQVSSLWSSNFYSELKF